MKTFKLVTFDCNGCGKALEARDYTTGQPVSCPYCTKAMTIDVPETPQRYAPQRRGPDDRGVPIKLGLGKAASFETTVSRNDAGRMAHTFLGGLLVALAIIVCSMLGINFSKRS